MNKQSKNEITQRVFELLSVDKETRDNDGYLFKQYIFTYHDEYFFGGDYVTLLNALVDKAIPSPETITRLARMLKRRNPELKGTKQRERKLKAESVRQEMRNEPPTHQVVVVSASEGTAKVKVVGEVTAISLTSTGGRYDFKKPTILLDTQQFR